MRCPHTHMCACVCVHAHVSCVLALAQASFRFKKKNLLQQVPEDLLVCSLAAGGFLFLLPSIFLCLTEWLLVWIGHKIHNWSQPVALSGRSVSELALGSGCCSVTVIYFSTPRLTLEVNKCGFSTYKHTQQWQNTLRLSTSHAKVLNKCTEPKVYMMYFF